MSQGHAAATKSFFVHTQEICLCVRNVTLSLLHVSQVHVPATCHPHVKTHDFVAAACPSCARTFLGYWGCAAGWGRIFTTRLTIMGSYFQAFSIECLEWGRTFWGL